ncbi:myo-inositol-1-monophosphatase [Lineolata rhizophorae]|uniref:Myo-inositol-1-monophosphatase n=1 Tax=Lineolata rhizophorae TaxID=578093 RepID=A0A6A6NX13_9PEZI|nr:myo-inositol-1-monophosphatase [Lineolata rhizophorae]
MAFPYSTDLHTALLAVQRASLATVLVHRRSAGPTSLSKSDTTPVTVADFAAQSLLVSALRGAFPSDAFLGEEDAGALRSDAALAARVWAVVRETLTAYLDVNPAGAAALKAPASVDEMLESIDVAGRGEGGGKGRVWVMDPVDGTMTYVLGKQWVVALALLEGGIQRVAVLGCPNLALDGDMTVREDAVDAEGMGYIISAVKGHGAGMWRMSKEGAFPADVPRKENDPGTAAVEINLVYSTLSTHSSGDKTRSLATKLGSPWPGWDIYATQMRYIACALGSCGAAVRIPRKGGDFGNMYDHAGGVLLCEEVGVKVTDLEGKPFDWTAGRTLSNNWGHVAAPMYCHDTVLAKLAEVLDEE